MPGVVVLPGWLPPDLRVELVRRCRTWGDESGGPRAPRMRNGAPMSVRMLGLGWHWYPYRYSRTRDDGDGGRALPFPPWLGRLARRAVVDAAALDPSVTDDPAAFDPDVALVNWYGPVFGGPARLAYHGVPKLVPGTDDPAVGDLPGRLNVTVRQTGLDG